jgi:hypothetical protein
MVARDLESKVFRDAVPDVETACFEAARNFTIEQSKHVNVLRRDLIDEYIMTRQYETLVELVRTSDDLAKLNPDLSLPEEERWVPVARRMLKKYSRFSGDGSPHNSRLFAEEHAEARRGLFEIAVIGTYPPPEEH